MTPRRTCMHCVLGRALAAEDATLRRAGASLHVRPAAPVTLPRAAAGIYRELRALLREAVAAGGPGIVRVALVDLPGRYCLEVLAAVARNGRARVFGRAFARHVEGTLEGGFLEGDPPVGAS